MPRALLSRLIWPFPLPLQGYKLAEAEATILLPCLVEKAGHAQVPSTPAQSPMALHSANTNESGAKAVQSHNASHWPETLEPAH